MDVLLAGSEDEWYWHDVSNYLQIPHVHLGWGKSCKRSIYATPSYATGCVSFLASCCVLPAGVLKEFYQQ